MNGTSPTCPANQEDDLCTARSLVALLRHVASIDGDMGDEARHGVYLVGRQVESILTICIEREGYPRGMTPDGDQGGVVAEGTPR